MARTGQAAHPSHGAVGGEARHKGIGLPEHRPIAIKRGEIALRRAVGGGETAAQVEPAIGRGVDACRVGRVIVLKPTQLDGPKRVARRIADVHVCVRRAALQALNIAVEAIRLPHRGQRAVGKHGGIGRVFRARAAERRLPRIGEVGQRHLDRSEIRRRVGYARVRRVERQAHIAHGVVDMDVHGLIKAFHLDGRGLHARRGVIGVGKRVHHDAIAAIVGDIAQKRRRHLRAHDGGALEVHRHRVLLARALHIGVGVQHRGHHRRLVLGRMQRAHGHERGLLGMRRELLGVQAGNEPVDPACPPGEDAVVGFRGAADQEIVGAAHGQALCRVVVVAAERFDAQARAVGGKMRRVAVLFAEGLGTGEIVVRRLMGARDDIAVKRRHDPIGGDGLAILDQVRPDDVARRADAHHKTGRAGIRRIARAEVAVGGLGRSGDDEAVVDSPVALIGRRHRGNNARDACRLVLARAAVGFRPLHRAVGCDLGNEHVVIALVLALKIAVVRVGLAYRQITRGHRDAVAHIVKRGGILHLHDGGELVGLQGLALHLRTAHARHPHQVQVVVVLRDDGVGVGLGLARGLHIAVRGRR